MRGSDSDQFDFEATEVWMEVFTDTVGDVDARSIGESQFGGSCGHVPAHSASGSGSGVRELETQMAFLHGARRGDEARVSRHEDRLGISVSQGLELAQPAGEDGSDLVEGQFGVDVEVAFRFSLGKAFGSAFSEAALELG